MKLDGKTKEELVAMSDAICNDPANLNPPGSIIIYTPSAVKKLDKIARQIQYLIGETRKAEGKPINTDGYSGRQTNKRR